jgi:hypothetical protein
MKDEILVEEKEVTQQGILPAGRYTATIESAKHFEHKTKGHDVIQVWLEVENEQTDDNMITKHYNLTNQESKGFFIGEMLKLGIKIRNRQDVKTAPEKLIGLKVDIALTYNDMDFPVTYIMGPASANSTEKFDPNSLW